MRVYAPGMVKEYAKDFIANVWNWDKLWKVEWLENGKVMGEMKQYEGIDPFAKQMVSEHKKEMQSWISALPTKHLFRATPRNAKEVRVTDRFGNVYQQAVPRK